MSVSRIVHVLSLIAVLVGVSASQANAQARPARFLAKEDILLYGIGLKVEPAQQTVPKDIATIVSTYLQSATAPDGLPPFAPDAEVRATLAGPSFSSPRELVTRPNTPFQIPPLTVPGVHTLENIRLVSNGEVLLYGAPQSVRIEVLERLLVTQVTARPLTAAEIREKGISFDRSSFQAYNFSAAFAVQDKTINLNFPVLLPALQGAADQANTQVQLQTIAGAQLPSLQTIIPDTLRIQTQVPNLSVVGFTLKAPQLQGQQLVVPPIPGVVVIPGDIGFLNQFFSVMLMVGNVAPAGSNLVVSDMKAEIVLPAGIDGVVGSGDDPLRMARVNGGESPRIVAVVQPGGDAKLGTADDIVTIGPGETGNAEYLVEGRREGSHVIEMAITATLNGLPVGPVPITGRAAGAVLVRNPKFTLTFTHPEVVSAGEPYTLDVTVTNTSPSPANLVSLNLYPRNVAGATIVGDASREIDSIAAGDSATVSFDLVSKITGKVTAATLDSNENVAGRFALKTAVGELNVPLSPDSLVLPKESSTLPKGLRDAAIGLLGKAWAVATAPPAAMPPDLSAFSRKIVLDRAVEVAEAGLRVDLHEPLADSAAQLAMDFAGSNYARLSALVAASDLDFEQTNFRGFDELRRKSIRGDAFAAAVAAVLGDSLAAQGAAGFHQHLAERWSYRPAHVSVLAAGAAGGALPYDVTIVDANGRRLGGTANGKVVKEIPFSDLLPFTGANDVVTAQLALLATPSAGALTVRLTPRPGIAAGTPALLTLVLPDANGGLKQFVYGITGDQLPSPIPAAGGPISVSFELAGATAPVPPVTTAAIVDPSPTVISVVQQADADQVRCDPAKPGFPAGRIVAVLFSEEVTPESVQDRLAAESITHYGVDANQVVGVALQPGRRIAFLALRDPFGPFIPRSLTIHDIADARGHVMPAWTGPMEATVDQDGAVVSGHVLDASGNPMPFADVRLFYRLDCGVEQAQWVGISSKTADASGAYSWDYVSKPLLNRILAVDTATDDFRNVQFNVQRQGQRLNVDIVFLGRGSIQGTARSEEGAPLVDTAIRVTSLTDQSQYAARTDVYGHYSIARVPVGNIFIEAVNVAANAKVSQSDYIPSAGSVVQRDLTLLDVEKQKITVKHGTVHGFVYRDDGVTPAGGVPVFAYYASNSQPGVTCPPNAASPCAIARTTTAADGAYSFVDITAGQLSLSSFDQTGLSKAEVSIVLAADGTATANLLLSGGLGTVTGKVLTADGQPVDGAQVGGGLSLTTTNGSGEFTLVDVPVGHREIVAVSQALAASGKTTIDIVRPGEVVSTTIVFDAQGTIAGQVLDANGAPVNGVTVYAFRPSTAGGGYEIVGSAPTNAQGGYTIPHVPAGTFKVSAFNAGFTDGNITSTAVKFDGQTSRADIRFRGGAGKITGVVYNDQGNTPLKARVGVSGDRVKIAGGLVGVAFERVENFAIADSDLTTGQFNLSGILVGPFTLNAVGQFSPDPISVEGAIPSPGATVTVDLRLQATSQIRGIVTNPNGTPVGADVVVRYKSEEYKLICTEDAGGEQQCDSIPQGIQEENVVTDTAGRFWLPVVNAGSFTLTVEDPQSGKVGRIKGSVRPGETAEVPVRLLAQGSVEVRVLGSDTTTAIPGAKVVVTQLGYPQLRRELIADPSGVAIFTGGDGLTEGDFVVEATDVRNGFAGRASGRITVDGAQVVAKVYLFNATGTVQGIVYGADGFTPAANADVIVANNQGPLAFAVTGPEGTYSLDQVPLGDVHVEVFDARTGRRGNGSGRIDFNGQQIPVNVVLASVGVVKGIVLDNATRAPLKGWTVTLQQRSASGVSLPVLTSTTGVDGRFLIPGAGRGTFTLTAAKSGVSGNGTAGGALDQEGQVVDVPMLVTIARALTGTITGTVLTSTGAPAADSIVEVCAQCGGVATTITADAFGAFSLANAPLGRFTVRARSQVSHDAGSAIGELRTDGDVAAVAIAMEGVAQVTGTVERADGTKVSGAQVVFDGYPASACGIDGCTSGTNGSGEFSFVDQPARSFTVTATDPVSKLKGTAGGPLTAGEHRVVRIVLAPTAALSGRVVTAAGQPASGIVAELIVGEATADERRLYKQTLADGTFVFPAAPIEAYRLVLADPVGSGIASRTGQLTADLSLGDIVLDEAPPAVATLTPQASSTAVAVNQAITIVFSEPIQPGTINANNVRLTGPNGAVTATRDVSANDTTVVLTPLSPLAAQTRYTLRITAVADRIGKVMAADYTAAFTTVDLAAPVLAEASPAANTGGVTIYTPIRLRFSEPIDPTKFVGQPITVTGPSGAIAGRLDYLTGNTVLVFTPNLPLAENVAYQVQVAAATDIAGNKQAAGTTYQFSTTDRTPPQIAALVAGNDGKVIENGTATVTADVGATSDVLFVDFYVNGALAFVDREAPFALTFQATPQLGAPGATIAVSAIATDTSGNRGIVPAATTIAIVADQLPAIAITAPAADTSAKNGDHIVVTVRATDDLGVKTIGYHAQTGNPANAVTRDVAPASADRTETFAFDVPADAAPGSIIQIDASAVDTYGHVVSAAPARVTVLDAVAPVVTITGATTGARVAPGQQTTVIVTATDQGGVSSISFAASGVATRSESRPVDPAQASAVTSFTVTVPTTAQPGQSLMLDATAVDRAGNSGAAARVILPVADSNPPVLSLTTESGSLNAVPGRTVRVVATATDETGVTRVNLSTFGAVSFTDARQVTPPLNSAVADFDIPVPSTAVPGSTIQVQATATDINDQTSTPVTLTLTVTSAVEVTLPASEIVDAGQQRDITVQLGAPAPAEGTTVTFVSTNAEVVTAPPSLTFAAGETAKTLTLTGIAGGTAQVRALVNGVERATMTVTVAGGIVSGIVRDSLLVPVAGAQVTVTSGTAQFSTTTDSAGSYTVSGVPGPSISVRVTDPVTKLYGHSTGTMARAQGVATVNVILIPAGAISGHVTDASGVAAGAGVKVEILAAAGSSAMATTFTDDAGAFEFPLVTLGNYTLQASAGLNRGRTTVSLATSGEQLDTTIVYLGSGTVSGTVRIGGVAVANAKLTFDSWSIFGSATPIVTNATADGTFSFDGVPIGSFTITAEDPATTQKGSATGAITVNGQAVTADVNLAPYGAVTGLVRRADNTTIVAGAVVTLASPDYRRQTKTDENGRYRFDVVPLGAYTLSAADSGTHGSGTANVNVDTHQGTKTADITFLAQGRLLVTVVTAGGQPVASSFVRVDATSGSTQDTITATTTGEGTVLIEHVLAGTYVVSANFGSLGGVVSGSLAANALTEVSVSLQPTGSLTGTVFAPNGQTPLAGVRVSVVNQGVVTTNDDGVWRMDNLPAGRYDVAVYDSQNRVRAKTDQYNSADDLVLSGDGEVVTRDLTMIGLGTVNGQVVFSSNSQPAGNMAVSLSMRAPGFEGARSVRTNAGGYYTFDNVPVGPVSVVVSDTTQRLYGEASGSLPQHEAELTLDIALTSNAITLPRSLWDANNRLFDIQAGGNVNTGSSSLLAGDSGTNRGAFSLDVISDGAATRFAGGEVPTIEDANREIVVRQENLAGLSVTRKIFVPRNGYFARYLEILRNPTAAPITVDLRVRANVRGDDVVVDRSSSGDDLLDLSDPQSADRWFVAGRSDALAAAFVVDGAQAARHVGELSLTPAVTGSVDFAKVVYGWNGVTVPAGGTVAIMHFGVQQLSRDAARASAERLSELPPEALSGLSTDELAAIANFAVPADGQSTVAPLPAMTGVVTGKALEADHTTPIKSAHVSVRSTHPLFGGTYAVNSDADGSFTFTGTLKDSGNSVAIPVFGFTLDATYPTTGVASPTVTGAVDPQTNVGTLNVEFANTGALYGTVTRHNTAAVVAGTVTIVGGTPSTTRTVSIGGDATYRAGGLPPGDYALTATTIDPKGTGLVGIASATVVAGPAAPANITMQPTGSLDGIVRRAGGSLGSGITVKVQRTDFSREMNTDSGGNYTFADMPTGTFTVTATEPGTGIATSATVTVEADQPTHQDLTLVTTGRVVATVKLGNAVQPTLQVTLRSMHPQAGGFITETTDNGGIATFNAVPVGAFTVTVFDTSRQLYGEASGRIDSDGQQVNVTIALVNNAIALPTYLYDASNFYFDIQPGGQIGTGVFNAFGSNVAQGGALLDIDSGAGPVTFAGASAGTYEDGGREIATRQNNVAGLSVTRKVFVPRDGYFARYLEILSNPSDSPVTVKVRLQSRAGANRYASYCGCYFLQVPDVIASSSGDAAFDASAAGGGDQWVTLAYGSDNDPFEFSAIPPVAYVFGGAAAAMNATAGAYTRPDTGLLSVEWQNVVIPANGTATLMHFLVQQTSRAGALASAERLAQLPPEVLAGLSEAEIASIRNFAVPLTGTSAVEPLPPLTGKIQGRTLASDGSTAVGSTSVVFRSQNPIFGRKQRVTSAYQVGTFSLTGQLLDYGQSVAIPAGPFTLTATHPVTSAPATATGDFAAGETLTTKDVLFTGTGNVSLLVTTISGAPIQGANVQIDGGFSAVTDSTGYAVFTGLTPGAHTVDTWRNAVFPQAGSRLDVFGTVQAEADLTTAATLSYPGIGQLTGKLLTAAGAAVASRTVTIADATGWSRNVKTVGDGTFTLTDLPEGVYHLTATDPQNGAPADIQVVILDGHTTEQNLTLPGRSTVVITVTYARGALAANSPIELKHIGNGSFRSVGKTDANGQLTLQDIPVGAIAVRAFYPGNTSYWTEVPGSVTENGGTVPVTVVLPGLGNVHGTLTTADGTGVVANRWIQLRRAGTDAFFVQVNTDANGKFQFAGVPLEESFHVAALHPNVSNLWSFSDDFTLHADGDDPQIDLALRAVASLKVQVQRTDGSGWPGLRVEWKNSLRTYFDAAGDTNDSGELTIGSVPQGPFTIRIRDDNTGVLIGERSGTIAAADDATVVTFPVPVSAAVGTVTGRVLAADGVRTVSGVSVSVYDTGENKLLGSATTGSDGSYQFAGVLSGPQGMTMRAVAPNNATTIVEQHVTIESSGQTVTQDLVLPVTVGTVKGVVTAASGAVPLEDVFVQLKEVGAPGDGIWLQTNASGAYEIADVAFGGAFTVEASVSGLTQSKTATFTSQGQVVTLDFTLPVTVGSVQGTVFAGDGATVLSGVDIYVTTANGEWLGTALTNSLGAYSVPNVYAPGPFVVEAWEANASVTATADFASDGTSVTRNLVLPLSVIRGRVTQADGSSVSRPNVFVETSDRDVLFPYKSPATGDYVVIGAPLGPVRITAQDRNTGIQKAVDREITDITVAVEANITLPGTGTVTGHVFDQANAPVPGAWVELRSDSGRYDWYEQANEDGVFTITGVAEGPVTLSSQVYDNDDNLIYLTGAGTVKRDDTVTIDLLPVATGTVTGTVVTAGGVLMPDTNVEIVSVFSDDPYSVTARTNDQGVFSAEGVPAGPIYLTASGPDGEIGKASGTLAAGGTLTRQVTFGTAVSMNYTLSGDDGFKYEITAGGELRHGGSTNGDVASPFDWAAWLEVNGESLCCPDEAVLGVEGRQLTFDPDVTDVFAVTRSVFVPQAGGFARFLDVLYNPTDIPRTVNVAVHAEPTSGSSTRWVVKPASTGFRYAVHDDGFDGATLQRSSVGYVMAGTGNVPVKVTAVEFDGDGSSELTYQYTLTIQPRQRVAFMHFALQRNPDDAAGAQAAAAALSTLSDPNALTGLTAAEKAMIVNFVIAP